MKDEPERSVRTLTLLVLEPRGRTRLIPQANRPQRRPTSPSNRSNPFPTLRKRPHPLTQFAESSRERKPPEVTPTRRVPATVKALTRRTTCYPSTCYRTLLARTLHSFARRSGAPGRLKNSLYTRHAECRIAGIPRSRCVFSDLIVFLVRRASVSFRFSSSFRVYLMVPPISHLICMSLTQGLNQV